MKKDLLLAIDVGTGSVRAALITLSGETVAFSAQEHDQIVPQFGWSEQRPASWWQGAVASVRTVLGKIDQADSRVAGGAAGTVFALGLIEAGAVAILTISASTAYAAAECVGVSHSFNSSPRDARLFYTANVGIALLAAGVRPQDHVAFIDMNGPEYFEVLFGCAKVNAVNVAVNWRLAPGEMASTINDAEARAEVSPRVPLLFLIR